MIRNSLENLISEETKKAQHISYTNSIEIWLIAFIKNISTKQN